MSGKLEGKVALVTGASTGIGKATAIDFAKEGAKVVLSARTEAALQAVAEEITSAGGEAVIVVGDVSKEADCKRMVDTAVETFGGLHVAVNNAGNAYTSTFADVEDEGLSTIIDVNFKSIVFCFKYQIPAMAKCGDRGSIIINTSALGSRVAASMPTMGLYAATKAGANMLMKYAAIEGAEFGVRVNSVAPGAVDTPLLRNTVPAEHRQPMLDGVHLFKRFIESDQVAKVVTFLACDDSAMVTGSVYPIDAGYTIKA